MGAYDLPAMINKTLETTGQEKLFYIGHSMGTTGFMVMSNMRPEMSEKIELASFLAPVAYMQHAKSPFSLLSPMADEIDVSVIKVFLILATKIINSVLFKGWGRGDGPNLK